jgi:shikimate kinase
LRIKPEVLLQRLKHAKAKRPIIKDKSDNELLEFITQKVAEREPFYTKAMHVLEGDNLKPEDITLLLPNFPKK